MRGFKKALAYSALIWQVKTRSWLASGFVLVPALAAFLLAGGCAGAPPVQQKALPVVATAAAAIAPAPIPAAAFQSPLPGAGSSPACEAALKARAQTAPLPNPILTPEVLAKRWPLPPWPAAGSAAAATDMQVVLQAQAARTPDDVAEALMDASRGPVAWAQDARALGPGFGTAAGSSSAQLAQPIASGCYTATVALLLSANEAMRAINRAHNARHGTRLRPADTNPAAVKPSLPMASVTGNPSYPSARAASSRVWALLLAEIFPERRAALLALADRTALLRLLGGAHYPSDMAVGQQAGDAAFAALMAEPAFGKALLEAKAERTALR